MAMEEGEGLVDDKIIKLTSDETRPVLINNEVCKKVKQGWYLIGKLVGSNNKIDVQAMKKHFQSLWCPMDSDDFKVIVMVEVEEEPSNLFLFKFPNREVMEKVVSSTSGGPWSFDNQLLLLAEWDITSTSLENICFNDIHVWIQIKGLPLHLLHEDVGKLIGASIGEQVHRVRVRIEGDVKDRCIRVRTRIKTYKPLRRRAHVQTEEGDNLWVDLVYEGIPKVCQWCGRIDHESSGCAEIEANNPPGYGQSLLLLRKQGSQKRKPKEIMRQGKKANKDGRRKVAVGIETKSLVEDIITEIMIRLPVKSLLRFMCVCKKWYSLISSPEIVVKHNRNVSLFFHKCSSTNGASTNLLFRFSGLPMELTVPLGLPMNTTAPCDHRVVKIIGCCDGVVCLSISNVFALWNPATTQFRIIGKHISDPLNFSNCGFCFDPNANSFKIVYVQLQANGNDVNILTMTTRTKCWRHSKKLLPCQIQKVFSNWAICVGRCIYWRVTMERVHYILCFDMVNEAFNRIVFPNLPYNLFEIRLSCYKDNISLTRHGYSVVYMLNDCHSWTHVQTIQKPHGSSSSKRGIFIMDGVDRLVFSEAQSWMNDLEKDKTEAQLWMIDLETNDTAPFPWKGIGLDGGGVFEFYQYKESRVSF